MTVTMKLTCVGSEESFAAIVRFPRYLPCTVEEDSTNGGTNNREVAVIVLKCFMLTLQVYQLL